MAMAHLQPKSLLALTGLTSPDNKLDRGVGVFSRALTSH
jgi:hypothetical protein